MSFKEFTYFSKQQRGALLLLIAFIVLIQLFFFFYKFSQNRQVSEEERNWLALQTQIDSVKLASKETAYKIYPFNPNFITDFKGYKLGMKVEEIDRLLDYRKSGKFVNSAEEFQRVTKISDSLLTKIAPYFKFPEWVKNKKEYNSHKFTNDFTRKFESKKEKIVLIDINEASKEELMKLYGIGDAISDRILKQKNVLGGYVSMDQMEDVWGLSPEVIEQLNKRFTVAKVPSVLKININTASTKELLKFPYFKFQLAREIITYRTMNGGIKSVDDLLKIKGFPVEKVKIIAIYLDFQN